MTSSRGPWASPAILGGIALLASVGGFASCAHGTQLGVGGGGPVLTGVSSSSSSGAPSTSSGGGGGTGGSVGIGMPCNDGQCAEGTCTTVGNNKVCTIPCPPACPNGTYCSVVNGNPLCIRDLGQECEICGTAADCKQPSDACLTAPEGGSFCARDCSVDGICPTGYVCTGAAAYGGTGGGGTGGNAGSGGNVGSGGSAGTGGGAGTGGATTSTGGAGGASAGAGGAGGGAIPSAPNKWCVPEDHKPCACNAARQGEVGNCVSTNMSGTCTGTWTCNGTEWTGCTAQTPAPEICNGKDDNCNGQIDEGTGNQLCSFMGPPPANTSWQCVNGSCVQGSCPAGFISFPPGTAGCPCQVDSNGSISTCATAKQVGTITNGTGAGTLVFNGTLSSTGAVEVFTFQVTDSVGASQNQLHVSINFTMPTTNSEFIMDVEQVPHGGGGACTDTPAGAGTAITNYDWCVDGLSGMTGENPCGPTATNHCTDHSAAYYVRVYRVAGAAETCTPFQITASANGGACSTFGSCK